jgi:TRAP-type C4-dicarboxylate transport system substrate-binding protein
MKNRKKLSLRVALFLGCVLFIGDFFSPVQAQKVIEWRMLASWSPEFIQMRNILIPFVEKVNQRAAGKLKISWFGPEAVPPFQQLKPVRDGLFDALYTHPAYHAGEVSVGQAMDLITASGKERRAAALVQLLDEVYRRKTNVVYLGAVPDNVGYHLLLKKKIDKADFTGLKIRTNPFYDPLVKALHGAPVGIAPGEIYSALEKGVVDGSTWPALGAIDYKWYEVAKYMLRPRFGENVTVFLVNLNSWNRLPKDLQELLTKIVMEMEEEGRAAMASSLESEEKELQKRGMELLVLPPPEAQKFLNTFYERSWAELVVQRDAEYGPRLKEAADHLTKKK